MKQLLVVFIGLLFFPVTIHAQEEDEIIPVDWKEVKKVADTDPQRIKDLVARMATNKPDTAMTWNERILAYYGQSFLTPFSDLSGSRDLNDLIKEGKYDECLAGAKELLKKDPVNLDALFKAGSAISMMVEESTKQSNVTADDARDYFMRMFLILATIDHTGDGTEERPFSVTAVSDEYLFMRYYLDIWKIESQFLTNKQCDGFNLKETNDNYSRKQIFFDVSRVMEIERELLFK